MQNEQPYADEKPVFWDDMMALWRTLPSRTRTRAARQAGIYLHALWRRKFDLTRLPLALSRFQWVGDEPQWTVDEDTLKRRRFVQSHNRVRETLLTWHRTAGHALNQREAALFLSGFLKREGLEKPAIRYMARELNGDSNGLAAVQPGKEFARALRTEAESGGGPCRGYWAPDPSVPAAVLASEIDRVERTYTGTPLKQGPRITVFRATVFGKDTLVKRYDLSTWPERLKYLLRCSRGRRAWAVGETFRILRIPTPRPFGYLEVRMRHVPRRSYVFTVFEADAVTARRWVCRYWRQADEDLKRGFRSALQSALLTLYRTRIYHADTKLANLMARPAGGTGVPDLLWIDLECVRFGVRPTEHRIVRNLVQMNGSARNAWVSESDRITFLREMAQHYPFLLYPKIIEKIRQWTVVRWHKELRTRCGP